MTRGGVGAVGGGAHALLLRHAAQDGGAPVTVAPMTAPTRLSALLPLLLACQVSPSAGSLSAPGSNTGPIAGSAALVRPWVTLEADAEGGLCERGETVRFTATVENRADAAVRVTVGWEVESLSIAPALPGPTVLEVPAGGAATSVLPLTMTGPGFADVAVSVLEEGGEWPNVRRRRVGCEPAGIRYELSRAPDFDAFWTRTLEELAAVAPEVQVRPVPGEPADDFELSEVTLRSLGGVRVRGWLQVPRSKGPHAAVLRVPGYTESMQPIDAVGDRIVFSFNIRGHGGSVEDVPAEPVDYWLRGLEDKDDYFYRGAYMDCVRAMDYLCSRDDVDQDRLAVWGASQGGGLAFATAALDPRVDICLADIPWLCHWRGLMTLLIDQDVEDLAAWLAADPGRSRAGALKTLNYFDTMNLADRITCRTLMGVGLQDRVCAPETSFGTFNRVKGERDFRIYEEQGHGLAAEHYGWALAELAEVLGSAEGG